MTVGAGRDDTDVMRVVDGSDSPGSENNCVITVSAKVTFKAAEASVRFSQVWLRLMMLTPSGRRLKTYFSMPKGSPVMSSYLDQLGGRTHPWRSCASRCGSARRARARPGGDDSSTTIPQAAKRA